jgi:hypothetical protein
MRLNFGSVSREPYGLVRDWPVSKSGPRRSPVLATCEDCLEKCFAPKNLLDAEILDNLCSWVSIGLKGSNTMNHAVFPVSATGSTYTPAMVAMALVYQTWNSYLISFNLCTSSLTLTT